MVYVVFSISVIIAIGIFLLFTLPKGKLIIYNFVTRSVSKKDDMPKTKESWLVRLIKKIAFIASCKIMYRITYVGLGNIDPSKNYIFASNHISLIDPIALCCIIKNYRVMAKEELFKKPFLSWLLPRVGAFPIKRDSTDLTSMRLSMKILKKDKQNLILFPEATRNGTAKNIEPKTGAIALAIACDTEIIPVKVGKVSGLFGEYIVIIGKPYRLELDRDAVKDKEILTKETSKLMQKIFDLSR